MNYANNDLHQVRDVAESAKSIAESDERIAETASASTVGLAQRLERLE